jgi:hypothetical protein
MLPSAVATASAPAISRISWLNPTPQTITVYASPWSSPSTPQHSLPGGRYPFPGPDFHRLDHASFAWRTSGRGAGYPTPPPQIPACGFPAPGSCRRSNAIVGFGRHRSAGSLLQWHAEPGTGSGACVAAYLPFDRPPSLRHLRRRFQSALFDASTVLRSRPTPRLFLDSFVSSTSCRGPGSFKRLRAKRGLPGSNAILSYVMWPQTPAGRRFLA